MALYPLGWNAADDIAGRETDGHDGACGCETTPAQGDSGGDSNASGQPTSVADRNRRLFWLAVAE
jgi:hypothetical protein